MNKQRSKELVLQDEPPDEAVGPQETEARAINAEPWEPLPGMTKAQCAECRYFFATPVTATAALLCPDCAAEGTRRVCSAKGTPRVARQPRGPNQQNEPAVLGPRRQRHIGSPAGR